MSTSRERAAIFIVRGSLWMLGASIYIILLTLISFVLGRPLGSLVVDTLGLLKEIEAPLADKIKAKDADALATVSRHKKTARRVIACGIHFMIWIVAVVIETTTWQASDGQFITPTQRQVAEAFVWSAVASLGLFSVINASVLVLRGVARYTLA